MDIVPKRIERGHGAGIGCQSICPVCLKVVAGRYSREGDNIVMIKTCPEHGDFKTVVWRGVNPSFTTWKRPKTPSSPLFCHTESTGDCPRDCGLCPEHRQHTCTALLEVTSRCNLGCPVCFADSEESGVPDPDMDKIGFWYDRVLKASGKCNIQISGGEPTVRKDLGEIIALGKEKGFGFIQLNTNGLKLADTPEYAENLARCGLSSVFLQFDGVTDEVYRKIRGRDLWEKKRAAVKYCAAAGIGVVLVPTVVPGVNDHQIGDILRFALGAGYGVRGVHFQPISYFGRYPAPPHDKDRITLPEIMSALEEQTDGMVLVSHFSPPGCEHSLCSFHGNYSRTDEGLRPTSSGGKCCEKPIKAADGARQSRAYTARQWSGTDKAASDKPASMGLGKAPVDGMDLETFLEQVVARNFSISAMAFQDVWNVDIERLKGCCIHIVSPDGRLVPFCAYNLTSMSGETIHRGKEKKQ